MSRIRSFFLPSMSLALLVLSACSRSDATFEIILRLQDGRAPASEFEKFTRSQDDRIRATSAEALAKLQDTTSYRQQLRLLADEQSEVRSWAAFGLGQLGIDAAETPLVQRLDLERDLEVRLEIAGALGKVGSKGALQALGVLLTDAIPALRGEALLAIARQAIRGHTDAHTSSRVLDCLRDDSAEVRWRAAYALWRTRFAGAGERLRQALQDRHARVRMFALRGLAALEDTSAVAAMAERLLRDDDWRVRVDAARGLGRFRLEVALPYLRLADSTGHVRLAVLEALGRSAAVSGGPDLLSSSNAELLWNRLSPILSKEEANWPELGEALVAYARGVGREMIPLARRFLGHPHRRVRARLAEALAETRSPEAVELLGSLVDDSDPLVRLAAVGALARLGGEEVTPFLLDALEQGDAVFTAVALEGLMADRDRARRHLPEILSGLGRLHHPFDVEAAQMIFRALGKLGRPEVTSFLEAALEVQDKVYAGEAAAALKQITGRDYGDRLPRLNSPPFVWSWADIREVRGRKAEVVTAKGTFEITLYADDAPLTALNFVRLARAGFYDGLSFHRVVPNFVIQGGDPRGDLWGSPGYSIRSEFNRHRYLRGSVGMASAGKDTEGCQFFITHSPQPHLDGRYTVFGRVTAGEPVVDRIQTDDAILRISIR